MNGSTIKNYGGWILSALLVAGFFLFKGHSAPDTAGLQSKVDSANAKADKAGILLKNVLAWANPTIDSLSKLVDTLQDQHASDVNTIDAMQSRNSTLRNEYNAAKIRKDTVAADSICVIAMTKGVSDSIAIDGYQKNTDHLINVFASIVVAKDSTIHAMAFKIQADSSARAADTGLIADQSKQLKKLKTSNTVKTIIGGALIGVIIALSLK